MNLIVQYQCPQCGAPAQLEETDRFFECGYCRVRSFLSVPDIFRYVLPNSAPAGRQLIYFPYWRFRGMLFSCVPGSIQHRFVDLNQQAIASTRFPFSMGLRSQTQKLRLAAAAGKGVFLTPQTTKADLLGHLNEQFSLALPKPILHQAYIGETISLLYAPFYLEEKLMDGITNTAVGDSPADVIAPLLEPPREPSWPIHFLSTLCPACGWDLTGKKEALALHCANCRSVWRPRNGTFERVNAAHLPDRSQTAVYLPFWRIQAEIRGIQLNSYADLIRIANMPKVPQPGWGKIPFHFWTPAFKARPRSFLRFAAHITTAQPQEAPVAGLPSVGGMHSVTLPLREALESLTLTLAFLARPRRRMEALLPAVDIRPRHAMLVYLPFQEGAHELIHPGMNMAVSKNLLAHARNL